MLGSGIAEAERRTGGYGEVAELEVSVVGDTDGKLAYDACVDLGFGHWVDKGDVDAAAEKGDGAKDVGRRERKDAHTVKVCPFGL